MATAYGVAPILAMSLQDIPTPYPYVMVKNAKGKLVPKLDSRDMPITNGNYNEEVLALGQAMAPILDELKSRQAFGRRAAQGFNITYELLRRARNLNFASEVCSLSLMRKKGGGTYRSHKRPLTLSWFVLQFREGSPYRRLGLLNCNRFGENFFDDVHQIATKAVREEGKASLEQKAITTGKPLVELERQVRYTFAKAQTLNSRPYNPQFQTSRNYAGGTRK